MLASIEFLNELADRLVQATEANWCTPGRTGATVDLFAPLANAVVVTGDLHGNRVNYNKILKAIALEKHPHRHLVLQEVIHGGPTYPQGGCCSHMLLEDVAALKVKFPSRVHYLLSNHEVAQVTGVQVSKGGTSQNQQFDIGVEQAYGPAAERIRECYRDFILSCPLAVRLQNGVLITHTLPDHKGLEKFNVGVLTRQLGPIDFRPEGDAYGLLWGRDNDGDHARAFAKLVNATVLLNGHMPTREGFQMANDHQIYFDASGPACKVLVCPVDRPVTAEALVKQIKTL